MADSHSHVNEQSSVTKLILITIALLAIIYFLAKGCTSHDESATPAATHSAPATEAHH